MAHQHRDLAAIVGHGEDVVVGFVVFVVVAGNGVAVDGMVDLGAVHLDFAPFIPAGLGQVGSRRGLAGQRKVLLADKAFGPFILGVIPIAALSQKGEGLAPDPGELLGHLCVLGGGGPHPDGAVRGDAGLGGAELGILGGGGGGSAGGGGLQVEVLFADKALAAFIAGVIPIAGFTQQFKGFAFHPGEGFYHVLRLGGAVGIDPHDDGAER